jgi:hypothetical protein
MQNRILASIVLALALCVSGCATTRHRVTVSVVSAHAVLSAVQDTEMDLVCGRAKAPAAPACVPLAEHKAISAKLVTAFEYDGKAAKLAKAIPSGSASWADVFPLLTQIGTLVDDMLKKIPKSPQLDQLLNSIGGR